MSRDNFVAAERSMSRIFCDTSSAPKRIDEATGGESKDVNREVIGSFESATRKMMEALFTEQHTVEQKRQRYYSCVND